MSRIRTIIPYLCVVPLVSLMAIAPATAAEKPVKVYILAGSVKSVDTRPFYRAPEVSPRNQSFHYHGNSETHMLVGEAMGKAMVEMQKK